MPVWVTVSEAADWLSMSPDSVGFLVDDGVKIRPEAIGPGATGERRGIYSALPHG